MVTSLIVLSMAGCGSEPTRTKVASAKSTKTGDARPTKTSSAAPPVQKPLHGAVAAKQRSGDGRSFAEDYPIRSVDVSDVTVDDGFWAWRIELNSRVTVPHLFKMLEKGRYMKQLEVAAGVSDEKFPGGFMFFESDFYKSIDAAAESMKLSANPQLEKHIDHWAELIAKAQSDDGYLNWPRASLGKFENQAADKYYRGGLGEQYYVNNCGLSHELYNQGHFQEAAVSYYQATGKDNLLEIAKRIGDHLENWFADEKHLQPSGHQEIELGLVRLYRVTADERYLELAKMFLDERGHYRNNRPNMGVYGQDHEPVKDQSEAVGHVVRGGYMYSSMLDVSALTGDMAYADAARRIWEDAVQGKMYLTGGFGVPHMEGFPEAYDLPNKTAYCESCGSIASMFWANRLYRTYGSAKYYDVLERTLYNIFPATISLDGDKFNYVNPLESDGKACRSQWHGCPCCPPNIARMIAQVPGYIYAIGQRGLYVNLFVQSKADVELAGNRVQISQQTEYPWQGSVRVSVNPVKPSKFAVMLRIPGWAVNRPVPSDLYRYLDVNEVKPSLKVNGRPVAVQAVDGYAVIEREWRPGDVVELEMAMPIRRVLANQKVFEDEGMVALQRGPIVYCLESVDNYDFDVRNIVISDQKPLKHQFRRQMLNGVGVITGKGQFVTQAKGQPAIVEEKPFIAIPYCVWQNRPVRDLAGPMMAVWSFRRVDSLTQSRVGSGYYRVDKVGLAAETAVNSLDGLVIDTGDKPVAHGRLVGDAVTVMKEGGNGKAASAALSFSGNGYLNIGNSKKYCYSESFTVALWAKIPSALYWGALIQKCNPTDGRDTAWSLTVPQDNLRFDIPYTGSLYGTKGTVVTDNKWHHIAAVYDRDGNAGPQVRLYIDGKLNNSAKAGLNGPFAERRYELTVGGNPARLKEIPFKGLVDDIVLLDRAASNEEIESLFSDRGNSPPLKD